MKKSLVLAMAMALGVTASAYAANPFSDVPEGHWAYDAVSELAAAGIVEGYGDDTFGGQHTMTRYEMAQIVAKAMAKGANVDKLAAEFADELDNLGVRVANLEKKADNVKITGQIRYEYGHRDGSVVEKDKKDSVALHRLRTRLFVNGQVNDDWSFTARLQNDQNLHDNAGNDTTKLNQAYVNGRLGGLAVIAGRAPIALGDANLYDSDGEYVGLSYGKDLKLNAYYGQPTDGNYDEFRGVGLSTKLGGVELSAGYDEFVDGLETKADKPVVKGEDNKIWNVSAKVALGKDLKLDATYLNSDVADAAVVKGADTDGYVVGLAYKGASAKTPGSWGLWGKYYNQGAGTALAHTMKTGDWELFANEGFEGYGAGVTYALAKNMVYMVDYYDLEGSVSSKDSQVIWSRLQLSF